MNIDDLEHLDRLWKKIYPYVASQIMECYQRDYGSVLELGPFSGGISLELARSHPRLSITIGAESPAAIDYLRRKIVLSGLSECIPVEETDLEHLQFVDAQFDLVILRGAFFFLKDKVRLLGEIVRVLREGGMAFVGGGYGKGAPKELIDEIADQSRELNKRLGRKRISREELEQIVEKSEVADLCHIEEQRGLWITIRKQKA
ncbi:MAG: class I SAM-dependent methyltransferase [Deltaproteobacteria bacterium]|nr:MAG: class I SAM-dependent methyltransferase [Deltaproteobacteria bacterium]